MPAKAPCWQDCLRSQRLRESRGICRRRHCCMEDKGPSRMAERKAPQETIPASEAWRTLPWKKFQRHVYRLQKRIYRASQRGNSRAVHKLQKLLMKSEAARMLAVRRVTQENRGKKTAGVDGVKAVSPARRIPLARAIHPRHCKRHKPRPVRRVWIPKPGKAERRPWASPRWEIGRGRR